MRSSILNLLPASLSWAFPVFRHFRRFQLLQLRRFTFLAVAYRKFSDLRLCSFGLCRALLRAGKSK